MATVTPVTCSVGTTQYGINSRTNDGSWAGFSSWSSNLTATQAATEGVKYGYQAQARCFVTADSVGDATIGAENTYTNLFAPSAPTVTVAPSGGDIVATITPVTCLSGTVQYSTNSQIDNDAWVGYSGWTTSATASQVASGLEGIKYTYQSKARCYTSDIELSPVVEGATDTYISPITTPSVPVVTASTTAGYTTTYSWSAISCSSGTTIRYQYRLNVTPSGFDSGWAGTNSLSADFSTATGDQTYTVQVQSQCYNVNIYSNWSSSGSASYYCIYDALPIATSISGYWSSAPFGYLLEDGTAVSRTTYADLFAAIGTTYGSGDGSTTFNLPDSRGRVTVNKNISDTEFATVGQKYGEKVHLDTGAESGLVSHNHLQNPHSHTTGVNIKNTVGWADLSSAYFGTGGNYGMGNTSSTTATNQAIPASDAVSAHNTIQPSIVKTYAIKYMLATGTDSVLPAATTMQGYFSSTPAGYLLEDGSAVSRTTYSDLFAVIGTYYGTGDGSTTFNLPDSRGRVVVMQNPGDSEFSFMGLKYGEKAHLLTSSESGLKTHNHTQDAHTHPNGINIKNTVGWADLSSAYFGTGGNYGMTNGGTTTATNQAVAASNASTAHNTIQPSIVKLSVIKYTPVVGTIYNVAKGTSVSGYWSAWVPTGYLLEDGSAVSRATYAALFAVIGTTYGAGNGSTTFNLPNSMGRVSVNINPSDSEFNVVGKKFGEKAHLLTTAESGEKGHNHLQDPHLHTTGINIKNTVGWIDLNSAYFGTSGNYGMGTTGSTAATNQAATGLDAASPHNNIQPSIVQLFAIRY